MPQRARLSKTLRETSAPAPRLLTCCRGTMLLALERLPRGAAREELHEVSPKNTTNKSHTNQLVATVAASGAAAETNERQQKYRNTGDEEQE